jgi:hypothetical protein
MSAGIWARTKDATLAAWSWIPNWLFFPVAATWKILVLFLSMAILVRECLVWIALWAFFVFFFYTSGMLSSMFNVEPSLKEAMMGATEASIFILVVMAQAGLIYLFFVYTEDTIKVALIIFVPLFVFSVGEAVVKASLEWYRG